MRTSVRATRLLRGDFPPRESITTLRLRATGRKKSMCACNGFNHSVRTPSIHSSALTRRCLPALIRTASPTRSLLRACRSNRAGRQPVHAARTACPALS